MTEFTFHHNLFSDLHKDAYGTRPGSDMITRWLAMSNEQKQDLWDRMCKDVEDAIEREKSEHDRVVENFNEQIERNMRLGASSEEIAIRWFVEALGLSKFDLGYGGGLICYKLGLPYEMEKKFDKACRELLRNH